jgi:hypothetical protein
MDSSGKPRTGTNAGSVAVSAQPAFRVEGDRACAGKRRNHPGKGKGWAKGHDKQRC